MALFTVTFREKEPDAAPAGTTHKIGIRGMDAAQVEVRFAYALAHCSPFTPENCSIVSIEKLEA